MKLFFFVFLILLICNCTQEKKLDSDKSKTVTVESIAITPSEKTDLWNGKDLSEWDLFIEDTTVDVSTIWSITDGVINCTGSSNGYMSTKIEYFDYKLTLEWRWSGEPGNSGVLLHKTGPDLVWPKSIEGQLMAGNAGDFWLIGGTEVKEHIDKTTRRIQKKSESSEKQAGEWNKYEILCSGDNISLTVNGVLQNEATAASVQQGKICLQSEGKPIQFRNIFIEPLP